MLFQKNKNKSVKTTIKLKKCTLIYTNKNNICKTENTLLNNEFIYQKEFRTNSKIEIDKNNFIKVKDFINNNMKEFILGKERYICINYLND